MKKRYWLKIEKIPFKNCKDCFEEMLKKNIQASPWIKNIIDKYNYKFEEDKLPILLSRISVKELGFDTSTTLKQIYTEIKKKEYLLVEPEIAILSRLLYLDQPKGEWLRFATDFSSMVDTDGVPHLPKLGKALGLSFIETYWSYPEAIFHPHNEFVVRLK